MSQKLTKLTICALLFSFNARATTFYVENTKELKAALDNVNRLSSTENAEIILAKGVYKNASNLLINHNKTKIRSESGNANDVILSGKGMQKRDEVEVIFSINANHVSISGLTLKNVSNHLIQIRAENSASYFSLKNCILTDSYEQLVKVSGNQRNGYSDFGVVQNNRFEYSKGIGPNFYIGGIDAHRARSWLVKDNVFLNIASPALREAEHAIHFWKSSVNNQVISNLIIDSDRGIGFGLGEHQNYSNGGIISNNTIIQRNNSHKFNDVGISIENSKGIIISDNTIFMDSNYPNAIEYRFGGTTSITISGNVTNKAIISRDGASANLSNNTTGSIYSRFYDNIRDSLNRWFKN